MPPQSTRSPRSYADHYRDFTCETCGTAFKVSLGQLKRHNGRFCSRACSARAQSRKVSRICVWCGKTFEVPPSHQWIKCCSRECRYASYSGPGNPQWKNRRVYRGRGFKKIRQAILERDQFRCTGCGSAKQLVVHHIVEWETSHDNRPENLTTLCRGCHARHHQGGRQIGKDRAAETA